MTRDIVFLVGLGCVAGGLYAVDWRLAAITVGVFLVWLALIWGRRDGTT